MSLEVLNIGFSATFQDLGRKGFRHFGVPRGGAFDRVSLISANRCLWNPDDAPGIEITLLGARFLALKACRIALFGALVPVSVNQSAIESSSVIDLLEGDQMDIGNSIEGLRSYLCIEGGFKVEKALGSCSGLFIHKGSVLESDTMVGSSEAFTNLPISFNEPLRIVPSPSIDAQDVALLTAGKYVVSTQSNRVGLRLDGPPLRALPDRLSEPICEGSIQVTHSGQPIIIGPDGPTIGGYRTLAGVISADLSRVGQLRPDQPVRFEMISLGAAHNLVR